MHVGGVMHHVEINKRYSAIIAEYLTRGYVIDTKEMGGTRNGEKYINLSNGVEAIRIMIRGFCEYTKDHFFLYGIEIVVCKADNVCFENNRFDVLKREQFYEIGTDRGYGTFYGTREEAIAAEQVRTQRSDVRKVNREIEFTSPKALKIAKRAIRRMLTVKHIDDDDVRIIKTLGKRGEYFILFKNGVIGLQ